VHRRVVMPMRRLRQFLDGHGVRYVTLTHSPAYTAQQVAEATHVPGKQLAKTVLVKLDGRLGMAVVAAPEKVSLRALAKLAGVNEAELANERELARAFPGAEVGAVPPFGSLWELPVYLSSTLSESETIAFIAGTHTEVIALAFKDYRALVEPTIGDITEPS
jgi:Ala-tRNA(Pro) deacylase